MPPQISLWHGAQVAPRVAPSTIAIPFKGKSHRAGAPSAPLAHPSDKAREASTPPYDSLAHPHRSPHTHTHTHTRGNKKKTMASVATEWAWLVKRPLSSDMLRLRKKLAGKSNFCRHISCHFFMPFVSQSAVCETPDTHCQSGKFQKQPAPSIGAAWITTFATSWLGVPSWRLSFQPNHLLWVFDCSSSIGTLWKETNPSSTIFMVAMNMLPSSVFHKVRCNKALAHLWKWVGEPHMWRQDAHTQHECQRFVRVGIGRVTLRTQVYKYQTKHETCSHMCVDCGRLVSCCGACKKPQPS